MEKLLARLLNAGKFDSVGLVHYLGQQGIVAKRTSRSILVDLPLKDKGTLNRPDIYMIPPAVTGFEHVLLMNFSESGGARKKSGKATTVCGLSGKPLVPYRLYTRGDVINKKHASFSIPGTAVTATAVRQSQIITLRIHSIYQENIIAWVETDVVFEGRLGQIPRRYEHYRPAASAALEKSRCIHCVRPFFVADESAAH